MHCKIRIRSKTKQKLQRIVKQRVLLGNVKIVPILKKFAEVYIYAISLKHVSYSK